MRFRGSLKAKHGLATVAPVCVTAGQERGFGNPHAVFILAQLHFRERNNHNGRKLTCSLPDVKEDGPGAALISDDTLWALLNSAEFVFNHLA